MKHILRKIILSAAIVVMAFVSATAGINDLPVKTINGKKYYYYEVQPQETVYSLCHRFGVTREQIVRYNPSVEDGLKAYQVLLFPVEETTTAATASAHDGNKKAATGGDVMSYVVQKGETGYGISHKFGMTLDEFYTLNPSARDGVKAGQTVKVRRSTPSGSSSAARPAAPAATPSAPAQADRPTATTGSGSTRNSTHVITEHETLYSIARAHGLSLRQLLDANPGIDVDHYTAGTVLNIPSADGNGAQAKAASPAPTVPATAPSAPATIPETPAVAAAQPTDIPLNIAIVLPFTSDKRSRAENAKEFLRGFTLAVDSLRNFGRPLKVMAFDSKGTAEGCAAVLADPVLKTANVIIAPDDASQIQDFAKFAAANKIYLFNLYVIKDEQYTTNPYMVQCNTPHDVMYDKAIKYFINSFPGFTPVILKRKGGQTDKAEFTDILKKTYTAAGRKVHEIEYTERLTKATLDNLPGGVDYAFIPVSSKSDEFNKFIDAVNAYKKERADGNAVNLWGYSEWLVLRDQSKLNKANSYVFSRFYCVDKDYSVENLQTAFERWYGVGFADKIPKQGVYGFDTGMFLLNAMNANGGDFNLFTPPYDGLQNAFRLKRSGDGGFVNEELYIINYTPSGVTYKFGI